MKGKILLFDIDETIFDPDSFLNDFYSDLIKINKFSEDDVKKIKEIYTTTKEVEGYFSPNDFLNNIMESFPDINKENLEKIFWNIDLFNKNVYKDASVIKDLSRIADVGIFSKGEESFQKHKINFLTNLVETDNIHIFKNKIDKINDVLEIYEDLTVYFIDNELEVLEEIKKTYPEAYLILVDRKDEYENLDIIKIKDLTELKSLIYD